MLLASLIFAAIISGKIWIEWLIDDIFYEPKEEEIIDTSLGKLYQDIVKKLKQI